MTKLEKKERKKERKKKKKPIWFACMSSISCFWNKPRQVDLVFKLMISTQQFDLLQIYYIYTNTDELSF